MSPKFNTLTLAKAALQDTGVPRNPLQLDAINALNEAIQHEKNAPKMVSIQDVVALLEKHHALAEGRHNYFLRMANVVKETFEK
jgi:hypothetical protein